jgi:hypothetical protein
MSEPKALYQLSEEWREREDRPKQKQPDGDVAYAICADELQTLLDAHEAQLEVNPRLLMDAGQVSNAILGARK